MKRAGILIVIALAVCWPDYGTAEEPEIAPLLSTEPEKQEQAPKVHAVYGVTADDYLPTKAQARKSLRPEVRRGSSRPSFDLPDAFFFIGGPIFLLILLRVLIIFINGFEEKRKEEERQVASEHFNID
jgi:hypothetical protein